MLTSNGVCVVVAVAAIVGLSRQTIREEQIISNLQLLSLVERMCLRCYRRKTCNCFFLLSKGGDALASALWRGVQGSMGKRHGLPNGLWRTCSYSDSRDKDGEVCVNGKLCLKLRIHSGFSGIRYTLRLHVPRSSLHLR